MVKDLILCYHSLYDPSAINSDCSDIWVSQNRSLSVSEFQKQIQWLNGFSDFCTVNEILTNPDHNRFRVAITFDDGYRNNRDLAIPVLNRFKIPFTWFICSRFVAEEQFVPWWDLLDFIAYIIGGRINLPEVFGHEELYNLDEERGRKGFIRRCRKILKGEINENWKLCYECLLNVVRESGRQLRNAMIRPDDLLNVLSKNPGIEIGAHTHNHINTSRTSLDELEREVAMNLELLNTWMPDRAIINGFAYPYGDQLAVSEEAIPVLKRANLNWAVTTMKGYIVEDENDYMIPRLTVPPSWKLRRFKSFVKHLNTMSRILALKRTIS